MRDLSWRRELLRLGGKGAFGGVGRGGGFSTFVNFLKCSSIFLSKTSCKSKGGAGRGGASSKMHISPSGLSCSAESCISSGGGRGKDSKSIEYLHEDGSSAGGGGVGGGGVVDLVDGVGVRGVVDFDIWCRGIINVDGGVSVSAHINVGAMS